MYYPSVHCAVTIHYAVVACMSVLLNDNTLIKTLHPSTLEPRPVNLDCNRCTALHRGGLLSIYFCDVDYTA